MNRKQIADWTVAWRGLADSEVAFRLFRDEQPPDPIVKDHYTLSADWDGGGSDPVGVIIYRYGKYLAKAQAFGGEWSAIGEYASLAAATSACRDYRSWPHIASQLGNHRDLPVGNVR
jgi:hypothetical protein